MKNFSFIPGLIAAVTLALILAAPATCISARAQESYPEIHNQPIGIHLLNAQDGTPMVHLRVLLVAGYGQDDLKHQLWHQEVISDALGNLQLPASMLNLPWMQILVAQAKPCIYKPDTHGLSVERIRLEGLNATNPCGQASATANPGQLNFYVQKLPDFQKKSKLGLFGIRKHKSEAQETGTAGPTRGAYSTAE